MPEIRSRIRDVEIPFSTLVRGHLKTLDTPKPTYNDLVELLATRDQEQELKESRNREAARDQEIVALKQELKALEQELTAFKEEFKAMVESTDDLIKKANARYFQDSWHDRHKEQFSAVSHHMLHQIHFLN